MQNYIVVPVLCFPILPSLWTQPPIMYTPKDNWKEAFTSKPTLMRHSPTPKSGPNLRVGKLLFFSIRYTIWKRGIPPIDKFFTVWSKFQFYLGDLGSPPHHWNVYWDASLGPLSHKNAIYYFFSTMLIDQGAT